MKKLFKGKKVTVMGLGLLGGGVGVAKFFCQQGARVLVTDLKTKEELKESLLKLKGFKIDYILGRHRQEDFINTDLVVRNPGVPKESYFLKVAKEHKVPIETDITIFFKLCKALIIGITGTKGKSTVATLVHRFLKTKYPNTFLGGNIGLSPLELLFKITKKSKIVLELSSFELEDLKKSPKVAVITCIFADHLNRYKSLKEYIETKKIIFKYQKKKDILVLNYDDPRTRKLSSSAPSRVYFYSTKTKPRGKEIKKFGCFLKDNKIFFDGEKEPICDIKDLKIYGDHNILNILGAVSVAKLFKIPSKNIKKILSGFKGVSNRQEFIREIKGVKYFNDTTATMPEATIAALKTFSQRFPDSRIILIAGGQDKGLDYRDLTKEIQKKVKYLLLLPGSASDKLKKELGKRTKVLFVDSMKMAVKKSAEIAKKEDIVLLSPGAASFTPLEVTKTKKKHKALKPLTGFNLFKNEFDRGEQFVKLVKRI